jgi:replicative DNA helicase
MCAIGGRGEPLDRVTVKAELARVGKLADVGGEEFLDDVALFTPDSANAEHYARIVRDLAAERRMIQAGHQVAALGYEQHGATAEYLDRAEALIYAARSDTTETDFARVKDMLAAAVNRIQERGERDSSLTGAPSGLDALDRYTSGFQPGQLIVVGARTSKGKSALALDIVRAVGDAGGASALFSLEMSKEELVERLFAAQAHVDLQHIRTGQLEDDDWRRVMCAVDPIGQMGIEIFDRPDLSVLHVRAKARRLASRLATSDRPLRLVVVDYLQLMTGTGNEDKREEVIAMNTRGLKALAKELSIPVIALAQLNRDVEKRGGKPRLSDLRESGSLEQDADVVLLIHRDDEDLPAGEADIIVAKQRNGPVGDARVAFVEAISSFRNLWSAPPASKQMELGAA